MCLMIHITRNRANYVNMNDADDPDDMDDDIVDERLRYLYPRRFRRLDIERNACLQREALSDSDFENAPQVQYFSA